MVRFSEKETCKLVELYREHECLWNPKNVHYRNRQVNQAACAAIASDMNHEDFTAADVKTKLKALRGTYNQELIKIKRSADRAYRPNIKWFGLMETFIKKLKNQHSSGDNSSSEYADHSPEDIFPDDNQWEQQPGSNLEVLSVSASSIPTLPSESELEQSVRSISEPEVVTVTPEIQSVQCVSSSEVYTVIPEIQNAQPVSHSQVVTVSPEILTVKAVLHPEGNPVTSETEAAKSFSNPEPVSVTSGIKIVKSVSNSEVPSGTQAVKTISHPKYFTLIPEIQTSKSGSTPKYIMVTPEIQSVKPVSNSDFNAGLPGGNQNARYVSSSQVIALAPEIQQRVKRTSADETLGTRKRRHEETKTTSNNSTNEVRQSNNTRPSLDDFGDRNEDEMDAFGHFVALNLKKMSMQSALSAQTEILSVLTRHRLNNSVTNLPSNPMFPYILTNGSSSAPNSRTIHKVLRKS